MKIMSLAMTMCSLVASTALGNREGGTTTNSTERTPGTIVGDTRVGRILFLGNSITLHPPRAEVGWTNNWGMAASAVEKDYVHILARSISGITKTSPVLMIENIADFERQYATYDLARLKKAVDFKADTVVVAIGENVPPVGSEESKAKFRESVLKLLTALSIASHPTIIVRSSFWPDKNKDEILRNVCAEVGGVFVDISALSKDESNYARSERSYAHGGVAAHPGDRGMQAIADALLAAMKNTKSASQ